MFEGARVLTAEEVQRVARAALAEEYDDLKAMALEKNRAYGSSMFDPCEVFTDAQPEEAIDIRSEDKIRRLRQARRMGKDSEDSDFDLIGYRVGKRAYKRFRRMIEDIECGVREVPSDV